MCSTTYKYILSGRFKQRTQWKLITKNKVNTMKLDLITNNAEKTIIRNENDEFYTQLVDGLFVEF